MNYLVYIFFRIAVFKVYLMPFTLLYAISDGLSFILKHVVKYRKKVVYANLRACFPEKSEAEIKTIADKFYTNLSDVILEAIKGFTMSEDELHKRYNFLSRHILNDYFEQHRSAICVSAHFANWEWGVLIMGRQFNHKTFGVYKPLTNKYIDAYIERKRKKHGMSLLDMDNTFKGMRTKHDRPAVFILIADQSPSSRKKAVWCDFLDIKTACSPGVEVASKLFKFPIIFIIPQRIKRGCYEVKSILITDNNTANPKDFVTQTYMSLLEKSIREKPEDWLWSHRRWKHKYDESEKEQA